MVGLGSVAAWVLLANSGLAVATEQAEAGATGEVVTIQASADGLGVEAGFDAFRFREVGFTDLGEVALGTGAWFGPLDFLNPSETEVMIVAATTSSPSAAVVGWPEVIGGQSAAMATVLFEPRRPGWNVVEVTLQGASGEVLVGRLRAWVVAQNAWQPLAFHWPELPELTRDFPWIEAEELAERLAEKVPPLLVDARPAAAFSAAHLAGSRQQPLFALLREVALKDRSLVIVDEGLGASQTWAEIERLRSSGFSEVRWLRGGVPAARAAGLPIEGSESPTLGRRSVHPAHLGTALIRREAAVLDATGGDPARFQAVFPQRPVFRWADVYSWLNAAPAAAPTPAESAATTVLAADAVNAPAALRTASVGETSDPAKMDAVETAAEDAFLTRLRAQPLLVFAADDAGWPNLRQWLQDQGIWEAYLVEGGWEALESYLEVQSRSADNRQRQVFGGARNNLGKIPPRVRQPGDCPNCP